MGMRPVAAVIAGLLLCLAAPAHADPRAEIAAKARAAMTSYDAMDYHAARRLLNQALAIAKQAKLDADPLVAQVYLDLGIALLASSDQEAARVAFLSATQIDPKITVDAAYRSPELVKLLEEARAAVTEGGAEPAEGGPDLIGGGKNEPVGGDSADAGVSAGVEASARSPRIVFAASGGTGLGYVTGATEGGNEVQTCCIGASLVVLTPEIGYRVSRQLSIGVAMRLGLPLGANIMGHSTLAPAVLLRVHRALSASGDGLRVMGEIGGGILRNTIGLEATDATPAGMDTDIVAQGPLLVGAGIGYTKHLGKRIAVLVDVGAIAGIAVVDQVGSAINLNTGVGADMSVGLAVGF